MIIQTFFKQGVALDFVFFDPLNFKYVSIAKLKILIFLDFDITSW